MLATLALAAALAAAAPDSTYDSPQTHALVDLARAERHADDQRLQAYDATVLQRMSVGLGLGRFARDRLLFRKETAARVRWRRDVGAVVDVSGDRTALPMFAGANAEVDDDNDIAIALPYVPGRPIPWQRHPNRNTDSTDWVDPLDSNAEAFYRYTAGDSESIRAPGAAPIHVREIRVHPRRPQWNLGVGSLWFDAATGHLVRAVYRLASPMNIVAIAKRDDPHAFDDVPFWVKPLIMPMSAEVTAVIIEYGLLDGRFWLPTSGLMNGHARAGPMRVPFTMEARYRYTSVNAKDSLPSIPVTPPEDSAHSRRDSTVVVARRTQCAQGTARSRVWSRNERRRDDNGVAVLTRTPCDTAALARSATLPPSTYNDADFGPPPADVGDLLRAISMGAQPDWSPRRLDWHYGVEHDLVRYNRVEGLSLGAAVSQELGRGFTWWGEARFGVADRQPNAELRLTQSDGRRSLGAGIFGRLVSANDWGDPFSIGSSVSALVLGDDEGFYYRAWGAEVAGQSGTASPLTWRLFAEREGTASVNSNFSFTHAFDGRHAPANLTARVGNEAGLAVRLTPSAGLDPHGLRLSSDLRAEGAAGTFAYARGAADMTMSHGLTSLADGAITLGAGLSAGQVPPQRLWYLGGGRTVRGLAPGTEAGDAYWLARAELGPRTVAVKPVVFYDFGWAGSRHDWGHQGRAMSGAGAGLSLLDGLIRVDVAHGMAPTRGWRVNAYFNAAF